MRTSGAAPRITDTYTPPPSLNMEPARKKHKACKCHPESIKGLDSKEWANSRLTATETENADIHLIGQPIYVVWALDMDISTQCGGISGVYLTLEDAKLGMIDRAVRYGMYDEPNDYYDHPDQRLLEKHGFETLADRLKWKSWNLKRKLKYLYCIGEVEARLNDDGYPALYADGGELQFSIACKTL